MNASLFGTIFQSENTASVHRVVAPEIPDENLVVGVYIEADAALFRHDETHVLLIFQRHFYQPFQETSKSAVAGQSIVH